MLLLCNCFQSWGAKILLVHRILFGLKKIYLHEQKHSHFSGWIVRNGDLNFLNVLSLKLSYIGGIQDFELLFKPVLIGLGMRYFDTMRTTVNCYKCHQKVIFSKYWCYEVLTRQQRYILVNVLFWRPYCKPPKIK